MANLSNINNKFLVTTTGEVLVGRTATTGTSKLQVSGSLLIGTDISSGIPLVVQETTADGFAIGFMRNTNATNGNGLVIDVNSTAGAYIQDWRQASTVKMRLLQNGNLGIGTDSPTSKLTVSGPSNAASNTPSQAIVDIVGSSTAHLLMGTASVSPYGAWINTDATSQPLVLMGTGGNVGIGTHSPLEKLNIVETTATAGTFFPVAISGARYQADYGVGIAFRPENNSSAYANKTAIVGSGGDYGYNMADLHFCLNQSTTITDEVNLSDTRMIIKKSGNVGIGTNSPDAKLHIYGSASLSEMYLGEDAAADKAGILKYTQGDGSGTGVITLSHWGNTSTTQSLAIKYGGNVGIGTTSPSRELDIQASSGWAEIALRGNTGGGGSLEFWTNTTKRAEIFADTEDIVFRNTASNVERMRIASTGETTISNLSGNTLTLKKPSGASLNWNDSTQIRAGIHGLNGVDGLQFLTGSSQTERMRISADGTLTSIPAAGAYGIRQNGVSNISNSGYIAGNGTLSFNYDCDDQASMFIECVFNHYGLISNYGCARIATVAMGPNIQVNDIQNISSGNGGSWTFTRVSNTRFTIAKTAGTYAGGGYYFVNIRGNDVAYT